MEEGGCQKNLIESSYPSRQYNTHWSPEYVRMIVFQGTSKFSFCFIAVLSAVGGIKQSATSLTQGIPIYVSHV